MKINPFLKVVDKSNIEQKNYEKKEIFIQRIEPYKNHKIFEYNTITKELKIAEFSNTPTIKWEDAIKKNYSIYRKIIKSENCIYFSSLNFKNAFKILRRDYNVKT